MHALVWIYVDVVSRLSAFIHIFFLPFNLAAVALKNCENDPKLQSSLIKTISTSVLISIIWIYMIFPGTAC